ncbi:MAG: hypothetical protein NTZ09_16955 [Candidatus Hydrogenedentes bacterium]|nr:hypothetical protein [Candidatus Hydrogenedentota bacterium]
MTNPGGEPHDVMEDSARRQTRRFVIYCVLVMLALIFVRVAAVPACKEVYSDLGGKLPAVTLWALTGLEKLGFFLLIVSAAVTVAVAAVLYRLPPNSQWRRHALLIPAAGVAIVVVSLFAMFLPMLS